MISLDRPAWTFILVGVAAALWILYQLFRRVYIPWKLQRDIRRMAAEAAPGRQTDDADVPDTREEHVQTFQSVIPNIGSDLAYFNRTDIPPSYELALSDSELIPGPPSYEEAVQR